MGEKKGSGMVGNGDYMLAALKRYFGFDSFRPGQEEAVGAVISGRDVMAVMPTGGGKSVCYQLPAARPGTFTLVVTPYKILILAMVFLQKESHLLLASEIPKSAVPKYFFRNRSDPGVR